MCKKYGINETKVAHNIDKFLFFLWKMFAFSGIARHILWTDTTERRMIGWEQHHTMKEKRDIAIANGYHETCNHRSIYSQMTSDQEQSKRRRKIMIIYEKYTIIYMGMQCTKNSTLLPHTLCMNWRKGHDKLQLNVKMQLALCGRFSHTH